MIINHNVPALNTYNRLVTNTANGSKSLEKLSSGLRINRAGDDAAGLAISEKMRGQIRGLDQAGRNAQDTISLIQTAEGGLNETHSILQRMRELAVQSTNDTNTDADRKAIQSEVDALTSEIDRIGNTTEFNTKKLLNGDIQGVEAKVDGTYSIQNNSAAKLTVAAAADSAAIKASAAQNGAYTITRIDGGSSITASFEIRDAMGAKVSSTSASYSTGTGNFVFASNSGVVGSSASVTFTVDKMNLFKAGESFTITFNKQVAAQTSTSSAVTTLIGANSGQTMQIGINDMRAQALGVRTATGSSVSVSDKYAANAAVATINNAIEKVSLQRSKIGALQNRLEHTINNLSTASENLTSSESRIRDVDMAKEMMNYTKNNILTQAAQAMMAQANQAPQGVLQLLR